MVYFMGYPIPSDTIPWYVWDRGGVDTIPTKGIGMGPNWYHTMVRDFSGIISWYGISLGYPMRCGG